MKREVLASGDLTPPAANLRRAGLATTLFLNPADSTRGESRVFGQTNPIATPRPGIVNPKEIGVCVPKTLSTAAPNEPNSASFGNRRSPKALRRGSGMPRPPNHRPSGRALDFFGRTNPISEPGMDSAIFKQVRVCVSAPPSAVRAERSQILGSFGDRSASERVSIARVAWQSRGTSWRGPSPGEFRRANDPPGHPGDTIRKEVANRYQPEFW